MIYKLIDTAVSISTVYRKTFFVQYSLAKYRATSSSVVYNYILYTCYNNMATENVKHAAGRLKVKLKGNHNVVMVDSTHSTITVAGSATGAEKTTTNNVVARRALSDIGNRGDHVDSGPRLDDTIRILIIGDGWQEITKALSASGKAEESEYQNKNSSELDDDNFLLFSCKGMDLVATVIPPTLSVKAATTSKIMKICALLEPGPHVIFFPIALSEKFDQEKAKKTKAEFQNMRRAFGDRVQYHTYLVFTNMTNETKVEVKKYVDKFPDLKVVVQVYCQNRVILLGGSPLSDTIKDIVSNKSRHGSPWYGNGPFETMTNILDNADCGNPNTHVEKDSGDKINENDVSVFDECTPSSHAFKTPSTRRKSKKRKHQQDRRQLEFTTPN